MELKDFKVGGKFRIKEKGCWTAISRLNKWHEKTFVCTDIGMRTVVASSITGVERFKNGCNCYPPLTEEEAFKELDALWAASPIPIRWATDADPASANILMEEVFDALMMPHCEALP